MIRRRWYSRLPRGARPLPAYLLAAALAVFLFIPRAGEVREMQSKSYDFHMRAQAPRLSSEVAVVRITDDDYASLFRGTSPLDTGVVRTLIDAARKGGAAVVGVDLLVPAIPLRDTGVVWAQVSPVAAHDTPAGNAGLALLHADSDWVIRRFAPLVRGGTEPVPIFSTAVLRASGREFGTARRGLFSLLGTNPLQERLIEFREANAARLQLSASDLLRLAEVPGFAAQRPLEGKIVLVGGDYDAARDRHMTPLGFMAGVDIWAQILETELSGGGSVPPGWLWPVILQLACATLIIVVFRTVTLGMAMLAGAVALPALSVACGLLAFGSAWHALYFFPSLIVILFWEVYDRTSDYLKVLSQRYT